MRPIRTCCVALANLAVPEIARASPVGGALYDVATCLLAGSAPVASHWRSATLLGATVCLASRRRTAVAPTVAVALAEELIGRAQPGFLSAGPRLVGFARLHGSTDSAAFRYHLLTGSILSTVRRR